MTYKIQNDISLLEKKILSRENHSLFSPTDRQINKLIQQIAEHKNLLRNWAKITATFKIKYKALSYSSILGEIHPHECLKR